jgi:predicted nucleic acid-binding protein
MFMSAGDLFFVDTNLLLYYVDPVDIEKQGRAAEWLHYLWSDGVGRLSWQVLHEFYWNAVRKMGLAKGQAREVVEDLALWKPVDTSLGLIRQAWQWTDSAQLPYWDALILAAAERSGARYLLSEDFQADRRFGDIRVVNPFKESPANFAQPDASN